jgi:hypothetical protein
MSMYDQFKADPELESTKGVVLDYGDFRVTILRASGTNKAYQRALDAKTRPYRRAIQTETMNADKSIQILREVYAECIVKKWEVKDEDGKWTSGVEGPDGKKLPFNSKNVLDTFNALPDLFLDIQEQSSKLSLFRASIQEASSGN